jgi:endonuclease YncB( thermonuclease family)
MKRWLVGLGLAAAIWACSAPADLVGRATVVDGDTLEMAGQRLRLVGVDAPESSQICTDASDQPYRCGAHAANRLAELLEPATVRCQVDGRDAYGRGVALCWLGDRSINAWLVEEGLAWAYLEYGGSAYAAHENAARQARRGVWQGSFVFAWKYRKDPASPQIAYTGRPQFDPTGPDRDCSDFDDFGARAWVEVQIFFEAAEQIRPGDKHRLDANKNGIACDALRQ